MSPNNTVVNEVISTETSPLISKQQDGRIENQGRFLYFSIFSVGLIMITGASFAIWTSPVLRKLKSNDTDVNPLGTPISTYQTAVLAGMLTFGNMLGPFVLKLLLDSQGRKLTLLILSVVTCVSTIIIAYSQNFALFCFSRLFIGLCMGVCFMVVPIYISEITQEHNRGKIGVMVGIFNPLGHLYGYITGPLLSVRMFTLICSIPLLLSIFLIGYFIPDSPLHLLSIGQHQKASTALKLLRNIKNDAKLQEEIYNISKKLKDSNIEHKGTFALLKNRGFRLGLLIILGLKIIVVLSGMMAISGFIGPIFSDAQVGISGDVVAIALATTELITFFFVSTIIEKIGRRILLLISTISSSICHALIGYYFYLKSIDFQYLQYITWLPITSVIFFYISFAIGLGCVPRVLMCEIFPINVRATAISLVSCVYSLFLFSVTFAFPIIQKSLGNAYCFWFYSMFCFLGFFFIYLVVPETKGRNIIEILGKEKHPL